MRAMTRQRQRVRAAGSSSSSSSSSCCFRAAAATSPAWRNSSSRRVAVASLSSDTGAASSKVRSELPGAPSAASRRAPSQSQSSLLLPPARVAVPDKQAMTNGGGATSSADDVAQEELTGVLLVQCPDAKGVVAALAQLLYGLNCNIIQSDQFSDETFTPPRFFQRITFDYCDISVGAANLLVLERAVADLAKRYDMEWRVSYRPQRKRMAVLVSKMDHCLFDLLIRQRNGELRCDIPVVVSNHPDLKHVAGMFGVDFEHVPFPAGEDKAAAKRQQEATLQNIVDDAGADLIVLARYMQIFTPEFCERNWRRTINIHHSFLPAFEGAKPYHRAHERGVKIIGATAHFATAELDAGPIIEQDIARITHRDGVQDMVRKGRDLERLVLARAVRWQLGDRVLVTPSGRTVVFQD